jgi:hypothetical protein
LFKSADVPLWLYDTNGVPKLLRSGTRSFAARPPFRELLAVATSTQVGEWVQRLAGEALAERGKKLSAFERADSPRKKALAATRTAPPTATAARKRPWPESKKWVLIGAAGLAFGAACAVGGAHIARCSDADNPARFGPPISPTRHHELAPPSDPGHTDESTARVP